MWSSNDAVTVLGAWVSRSGWDELSGTSYEHRAVVDRRSTPLVPFDQRACEQDDGAGGRQREDSDAQARTVDVAAQRA